MNIVVIGNANAGKSSLIGSLLVNSDCIDKRIIIKIRERAKQVKSKWLTHFTDITKEEQHSCKTLSMNKVKLEYNNRLLYFIDVPGQSKLVAEMCKGTAMGDLALLVISAHKGDYEASLKQTIEHTLIARGMGIRSLLIAINKMDSCGWDSKIYNAIVTDFTKQIKHFRFENIEFIPISATNGQNIYNKYDIDFVKTSLIDVIDRINIAPQQVSLIKPIDNKIHGIFVFNQPIPIITSGFKCILHSKDTEYDIIVIEIPKYRFLSNTNTRAKQIKMILKINTDDCINQFVILRKNDSTISIGKLIDFES